MNASWSGPTLFSAFASAGSQAASREVAAHERFMREKLALMGLVLAALPLDLAFGGKPSLTEATLFTLALLPLAAALLVARSGRLAAAQGLAVFGEIAIALVLAAVAGAAAALAWLVVALVETVAVATPPLLRGSLPLIGAAAVAILLLNGYAAGEHAADASTIAGLCACATAGLVAWRMRALVGASDGAGRTAGLRDRALVEVSRDAVAILDSAGSLLEDVAGCAALIGVGSETLRGRALFDLVNVADRPLFLKLLGDAAHGNAPVSGVLRLHGPARATGSCAPASRTIHLEVRARAAGAHVLALLRDVTDDLRREREIDGAQRTIDAALLAKDHFLANMSHELRTPLNAIIGFSEMLASRTMSPNDPAKQREYAGIIHQSGQHLLGIVNAILDMSKIQAGTFALLPEPFAMAPLVEQCCDVVRLQAQNGRIDVVRDVPADLEEIVGDRRVCRQILINLLMNAVKFTPEHGRVTLRVRPEGTALRIGILDTGIGIGEADLARLGDPFFQAGASLNRPYEGTGLGLSVVRGLVGLHGGSITIESALGAGTNVTVRLPLDCRHAVADPALVIETVPRRGPNDAIRLFEARTSNARPPLETRMKQSA